VTSRRIFLVTFAGGILGVLLAAAAQQAGKVYRLGILTAGPPLAFEQELRKLGYIENQNIVIVRRYSGGSLEKLADLASEIVAFRPDVILVATGEMARAAQRAGRTIPIVVAAAGDLVAYGFVASLAKPGGNVTGLQTMSLDLTGKRLELLREAVSNVRNVALLVPLSYPQIKVQEAHIAAGTLGMQISVFRLRNPNTFADAFSAITPSRYEGLLVFSDPFTFTRRKTIASLAATTRVPAIYEAREFVDVGGLISYGPNIPALYRRAAAYVDKILKGAKPGDLPVEQPTELELVINLKAAQALGLTVPQSLLLRADHVIQ
jgi:putative ABC transport system substrate-binding protein